MSKHSPNTSEYSDPHKSKGQPREHVDLVPFNEKGKPMHKDVQHQITDPKAVGFGRQTKEHRDK